MFSARIFRFLIDVRVFFNKETLGYRFGFFCSVLPITALLSTISRIRVDFLLCVERLWRLVYHGAIKFIEAGVSGSGFLVHVSSSCGLSLDTVRWDDSTQSNSWDFGVCAAV